MKVILCIVICFFTISGNGQQLEWAKSLGGYGMGNPQHIKLDSEGNIVVSGSFSRPISFNDSELVLEPYYIDTYNPDDIYLYKRNAAGELLWAIVLGGPKNDILYDMVIDTEDNILLVGQFDSSMVLTTEPEPVYLNSSGQKDGFLVKYGSDGSLIAGHALGGGADDDITTIGIDNDQNVILIGHAEADADYDFSSATHTVSDDRRLFILRLNSQLQFVNVFKVKSPEVTMNKIAFTDDGDYLISGKYRNEIKFGENPGQGLSSFPGMQVGYIVKISGDGDYIWGAKIEGQAFQNVIDFKVTNSGDIYLTGEFQGQSNFYDFTGLTSINGNTSQHDIYFAKLLQDGVFEWIKSFGGTGSDNVAAIELESSGNIILIGSINKTIDFDPGSGQSIVELPFQPNGFPIASYIAKYSIDGDFLSVFSYSNVSHNNENGALGIALSTNGIMYLSGWFTGTINFAPQQPGFSFYSMYRKEYLLKINANSLGLDQNMEMVKTLIYPNPANTEILLQTTGLQSAEIFDLNGRLVTRKNTNPFDDSQSISIADLPSGSYIIRLTANGGFTESKKLIVAR